MSQFNWQQDAEDQWEDPVVYKPDPKPPRPRRRWWLIPIILLLIGGSGWLVTQQANRRVEETTTAVTSDLLSSHSLLLQSAYNNDLDLFVTLLSGRDPKWTGSQQALLPDNLFFDRPSFGLTATFPRQLDTNTAQRSLISLDFAPDLLSAELVITQPYTFALPTSQIQTTNLQQTAVYRLGNQRWLYSPPEDDFWGSTLNNERDNLIVIYPQRDEQLGQRLTIDLEQTLTRLCNRLADINCPDDLTVTVVLSPNPDTMINLSDPQALWENNLRLVLPTPTLVGIPTDEAGYQALLRGYAGQLATAVIAHLTEWECCQGAPFFHALLDYQLSQLDLRSWPVTSVNYQRIQTEEILLNVITPYWHTDSFQAVAPDDQWLIYTLVDFLLKSDKNSSAATAQRSIKEWTSLLPWLSDNVFIPSDISPSTSFIQREWAIRASIFSQISQEPAPLPLPTQDLLLLCDNNNSTAFDGAKLFRYHLATDEWQEEFASDEALIMNPLPDDSAIVLQSFNTSAIGPVIWQNGQAIQTILNDDDFLISFGHLYPSGQMLLYRIDDSNEPDAIQLIDLTNCSDDSHCASEARPGLLAWSADGRQTIIAHPFTLLFNYLPLNDRHFILNERLDQQQPYTFYRTIGTEQIPIGTGFAPFWVDDETYGYLRPSENNLEIVIAKTADDIAQPLISSDTLLRLLPDMGTTIANFDINSIVMDPNYPNQLFIVTTSGLDVSPRQAHIFTFNLTTNRVRFLVQANYLGSHSLDFSPDGRWLIISDWNETATSDPINFNSTLFYDLGQNHSQSFATNFPLVFPSYLHDWSADDEWVALLADTNKIALILPNHNYYQLIEHDHGPCASLAWINPLE